MPARNHNDKPLASLGDRAAEPAETVEHAKRLGAYLQEHAEQATKAVGAGMESLGEAIHTHEPAEGILHNLGEAAAKNLESGGQYLETQGLQGVGEDLTHLIRQNPIPALLIGAGLGFLLAQMLKK